MAHSLDSLNLGELELRCDAMEALKRGNYALASIKALEARKYQTERDILLGHLPKNTARARLEAGE